MTDASDDFINMTATEAVARLRSKEVSPLDLVEASIRRIETIDTEVNALPIHCFDQARDQAKSLELERHTENPKSLCGLPIAVKDYNDLGGSLRTPAAFNGVVGLRPSPGRVPRGTRLPSMDTLWVEGPMARNVDDLALMLDAGVGHQIDDPLSFEHSGSSFVDILKGSDIPKRVAFSPDLSIVSMEKEIAEVCGGATKVFADIGAEVTNEIPDFTGVLEAFQTLRAVLFATMMEPILHQHRNKIAPEIIGNIERGLNIKPSQIFEAERVRIELFKKILLFFETHDFLICPAASIAPFPVDQRYVTQIDGKPCETYIDWFSITFALTMTACPTISVPCGFTTEGLPVGVQIMGKPRGEAALLLVAKRFEQAIGISAQLPILPKKDY